MPSGYKLSEDVIQSVKQLTEQGLSVNEIHKTLGLNKSSIRYIRLSDEEKEKFKSERKMYQQSKKEIWAAYGRKYRKNNVFVFRLRTIKNRARLKNLEFNLTIDDLKQDCVCPVFQTDLNWCPTESDYKKKACVDRVDNTKGYTKDNICIISKKANNLKSDMSIDEIKNLLEYVTSYSS